jgi:glutathione S-transferase
MITLHQFQISPFCDKVRRILQYKRVAYTPREVPLFENTFRPRRVNPIGKVPCIEHDGRCIGDSTDIALYLEERFPERPLLPKGARERAQCHVLEDWADESLYFYEMRLRFGMAHNARRWVPELTKHDPAALRAIAGAIVPRVVGQTLRSQGLGRKPEAMVLRDVERQVSAVAGWLDGSEWLVGNAITLADISVFAQLDCIRGTEEGQQILDAALPVTAWMARVDEATRLPPAAPPS